jgi:glucose-1-phosphate thymidylyltransferase
MSRHKAVVLVRGLGRRMREPDHGALLDEEQTAAADQGLKAMMPFDVPFLDYVISGLADAGFTDVCLVIGPEHVTIRRRYTVDRRPTRIQVSVAIQAQALGTANAVAAAESFAAGDPFIVINGDNYYPVEVLRALREVGRPAVAGFRRSALVSAANFDAARLDRFALIRCNDRGDLADLIEKPDRTLLAAAGPEALISMNCWSFDVRIFRACADVTPSARGELELPDAVRLAMARFGAAFAVLLFSLPVFDLSNRSDVQSMARHLATIHPVL